MIDYFYLDSPFFEPYGVVNSTSGVEALILLHLFCPTKVNANCPKNDKCLCFWGCYQFASGNN